MLSRRVPRLCEPNAWALALAARRAAGAALLDLTESNPTRVGLGGAGPEELALLADPAGAGYDPDPRGLPAARGAVAADHARRGVALAAEDVVLAAGTSEAYAHLFRLLADPGDAVLAPSPGYPLLEPIAALEGVRLVPYRLAWDGAWHVDAASFERAVASAGGLARAVVVVQPHHPTGSCLTAAETAWLEGRCEAHGLALISDEVFADFPRPGRGPLPSLLGARRVPTFALGGLSKSCAMPQLKLSWIALAGPEGPRARARAGLEWIADLFLSVATPVQRALPGLLRAGAAARARIAARLATNLAALDALAARRGDVDVLPADGGWSAVLRLPARRSGEAWALALLERNVVVHPGHFYDLEEPATIVVGLLAEPEGFGAALERLEAGLAEPAHV